MDLEGPPKSTKPPEEEPPANAKLTGEEPPKTSKFTRYVASHFTTIISILAMVAATASAFGTISNFRVGERALGLARESLTMADEARKVDREYREVSIRPKFMIKSSATDYKVTVSNKGLGPGIVQKVKLRKPSGTCTEFTKSDQQFNNALHEFFRDVFRILRDDVLSEAAKATGLQVKGISFSVPGPESSVAVGDTYDIFEIPHGATWNDELIKLGSKSEMNEGLTRLQTKFSAYTEGFPMEIRYCSATGFHCDTVGPQTMRCG